MGLKKDSSGTQGRLKEYLRETIERLKGDSRGAQKGLKRDSSGTQVGLKLDSCFTMFEVPEKLQNPLFSKRSMIFTTQLRKVPLRNWNNY